jgi:hypothetical protein
VFGVAERTVGPKCRRVLILATSTAQIASAWSTGRARHQATSRNVHQNRGEAK